MMHTKHKKGKKKKKKRRSGKTQLPLMSTNVKVKARVSGSYAFKLNTSKLLISVSCAFILIHCVISSARENGVCESLVVVAKARSE